MKLIKTTLTLAATAILGTALLSNGVYAAEGTPVFDEASYTAYVEDTMKKLDKLYLQFCSSCGASAADASKARSEYLTTVRDLLQNMNAKFDSLDPKMGAALSPTETLVSIHVLVMLTDMMAATLLEDMKAKEAISAE